MSTAHPRVVPPAKAPVLSSLKARVGVWPCLAGRVYAAVPLLSVSFGAGAVLPPPHLSGIRGLDRAFQNIFCFENINFVSKTDTAEQKFRFWDEKPPFLWTKNSRSWDEN